MMNQVYDFEKEKSVWLKAILPFLIIVHHCACMGVPYLGLMKLAGVTICTWFFLISGYGMMASFLLKGTDYLKGFIRKRFSKIAIPYIIALVVYLLWCMLVQHTSVYDYLSSQHFDKWLPYSWFIFVIMGGGICSSILYLSICLYLLLFLFSSV